MSLPPATLHAQYFPFGQNKVQYDTREWTFVQSEHVDVYYYAGGYDLARFAATAAEDALRQISELARHRISARIPLIIYQGHNDFAVTNVADLPVGAVAIGGVTELLKNRIAIPFTGSYRDFRRVIHHEIVHATLNDMLYGGSFRSRMRRNVSFRLPAWFNEGLAEYSATTWDSESDMWIREAVLAGRLPDIDQLNGYWAYRGGQGVWDYIAEQYGREKIGEILQKVRGKRSTDEAIQAAVGLTLDDLSKRWHETLREIHYPEVTARQRLEEIARPILTPDNAGRSNVSPVLSKQGDKIAWLSATSGSFDVYVAGTGDGAEKKKLIKGRTSPQFESLRVLTPSLGWSPDGLRIAVAVTSGPTDGIAIVHTESKKTVLYRVEEVDQILSVAWSPQGDQLAFEGSFNAQSDIFVLELESGHVVNLTADVFSDHEPAWSPDGKALVFHSDRGQHTQTQTHVSDAFTMHAHDYRQYDLYLLPIGTRTVRRLTDTKSWDETNARFGAEGNRLLFLSDRNGTFNLYEKDLLAGSERPLTDLAVGIHQMALSADGQKAALVALRDGGMSVYLLQLPFEQRVDSDPLSPTVWAQRAAENAPSPALSIANQERRRSNPFLRDASDAVPLKRDGAEPDAPVGASLAELVKPEPHQSDNSDSASIGALRIDFRNYRANARWDDTEWNLQPEVKPPVDNLDNDGNFIPKKYRLHFTPDLVYGTAAFDALYGIHAITQITFSDMLGNHRIVLATNLLLDLRNSDYLLGYRHLPGRVDWNASIYHTSRLLLDTDLRINRYRWFGAGVSASWPLNTFRRLDLSISVVEGSQADVSDPSRPSQRRTLLHPTMTYTTDVSQPGFLHPSSGYRFAVSVSGSPVRFRGPRTHFVSILGDARIYRLLGPGDVTVAARISAGASVGPNPQQFYASGVQNWINGVIDDVNGFPIDEVNDFVFATPVMPLRGHEINALNGPYFGLVNAELRVPLVKRPIRYSPFYGLQASAFLDIGSVWGNQELSDTRRFFNRIDPVVEELLAGAGAGVRTLLFGYPLRMDLAWPYDGAEIRRPVLHVSVGMDF